MWAEPELWFDDSTTALYCLLQIIVEQKDESLP